MSVSPRLLRRYTFLRTTREAEIHLLPALCSQHALSVDIGANIGAYTDDLLRFSKGVVAFEPVPQLARLLRRTFHDRIRLEEVALSNFTGKGKIVVQGPDFARSRLQSTGVALNSGLSVDVLVRPLDSFCLPPVGFMKIDVEGSEYEVLVGARESLRRDSPNLVVEIEERHRAGAFALVSTLLSSLGYRGYFLERNILWLIDTFLPILHQGRQYADCAIIRGPYAQYVNNFIFIHQRHFKTTAARLAAQGYSVKH